MIALCDQRSFYASCESVFLPKLRSEAIAVLSNNDGCVVALNEQAKSRGLKKFAPYFQQQSLAEAENINVFSSNYALYGEISRRIMDTLRVLSPRIEVYSIDECFCDLSGIDQDKLKAFGHELKSTIWREQRIPMGVSIGATKTLAKLGQYATKKVPQLNGVCLLESEHQISWLGKRTPVDEVWGVGRRLAEQLKGNGADTADRLRRLPIGLARKIGHKPLERTVRELNGEPCISFEEFATDKQAIVCSRSFGTKLSAKVDIEQALAEFTARAAEKLRLQKSVCQVLTVFLMTSRHGDECYAAKRSAKLLHATSNTCALVKQAKELLNEIYLQGFDYSKTGVELSAIRPAGVGQQDFWGSDTTRSTALMSVIDAVNGRYGKGTIHVAAQGVARKHTMRQAMLSPRYLTCWDEIPIIYC